ncbi:MAG: EAL domain-containing protein [Desulforhopalus sp.]|nr:EAL domain-containing protein [Desulforhopalus sp.]
MTIQKRTSKKIYQEQIHLLFANAMVSIIFSMLAGALLCWSLRTVIDRNALVAWLGLFFTIFVLRAGLIILFKKQESGAGCKEHWHWRFLVGSCASATIWGSASFFLFPESSPAHQITFFLIVTGVAAGGVASLCPSLPAVGGFLSLLLLPLIVKMMTLGNEESLFNGSLVVVFWAVTFIGAIKINANIRENIQLRLQSIDREKILKISEERYRYIFNNAPLGILHYDAESVIIDCNNEFVGLLGSSKERLIGFKMLTTLQEPVMINAIKDSLSTGEGYYEGNYTSITGVKTTPIRAFFKAIKSQEGQPLGGVGIVEDFTEKQQSEQKIKYHASYDSLTGLPNRRLLLEHLKNEMARARRHGHYGALMFIDLDNFKTINDSLGHSVGDELLKIVAKRISECIRTEDTAARMGGDEFVLIITELDDSIGLAAHKTRGIAEELSLCLSAPCQIEGQELHITPSVGVTLFPKDDTGVDDILKQADTAMYRAKAAGRNSIHFFLPSMQEAADERLRLSSELRTALDEEQFVLFFQPQVNISGGLVGAEALLRWQHPERGVIPPGAFLEIAEETGLMQDIGQWVVREACTHIKKWTDARRLGDSFIISVNISGKEIAVPDFVDTVIHILNETGADANHLGIELTEGSLISTGPDIVEKIMTLRQMGIKFSIDDFGTGYSSLSYLQILPLNTLKIDPSFVNDIKDASHDIVLVDTIIMMAQNLGLEVVAEGVETEQELLYLESKGCLVYQGYYFSKPVAIEVFTKMLESGSSSLEMNEFT